MIGNVLAQPITRVFKCGQAPNRWHKRLSQHIAHLNDASICMETAVFTPQPHLIATPLFGSCLAQLTERTSVPAAADLQPMQAKSNGRRPRRLPEKPTRVQQQTRNHAATRKTNDGWLMDTLDHVVKPDQLQAKADRFLLQQLAGETAVFTQGPHKRRDPRKRHHAATKNEKIAAQDVPKHVSAHPKEGDRRSTSISRQQSETPKQVTLTHHNVESAQHTYAQTISRRASNKLHQRIMNNAKSTKRNSDFLAHGDYEMSQNKLNQANSENRDRENGSQPNAKPAFLTQWAWSLSGSSAPESLLIRLTEQTDELAKSSHESERRTNGVANTMDKTNQAPILPATVRQENIANTTKTTINSTGQSKATGAANVPQAVPKPAGMKTKTGSHAPVMPPQTAPSLPNLEPPQQTWEPISPFTTRMAQQNNQDVGETAVDELQDLALKLKRILDEEARRFGIDV